MEWAHLMHLGHDNAAYREFQSWFDNFESNPKQWTYFYGYQVMMQIYEGIYGNTRTYTKKK